jgi:staphylococcal nuclease domain-containing protein 1
VLAFGNVEVVPEKGEEKQNVGELVVARGFASVIKHRLEEVRGCAQHVICPTSRKRF